MLLINYYDRCKSHLIEETMLVHFGALLGSFIMIPLINVPCYAHLLMRVMIKAQNTHSGIEISCNAYASAHSISKVEKWNLVRTSKKGKRNEINSKNKVKKNPFT